MQKTRKELLTEMIEENPKDEFLQYALYLEYQKEDDPKTESQIEHLLKEFPTYLPTYYTAAKWFENKEDSERALELYATGIKLATEQLDQKALSELSTAKMNLEFEM